MNKLYKSLSFTKFYFGNDEYILQIYKNLCNVFKLNKSFFVKS